jgi:DNA-binding NarL/FixJ family response regulator
MKNSSDRSNSWGGFHHHRDSGVCSFKPCVNSQTDCKGKVRETREGDCLDCHCAADAETRSQPAVILTPQIAVCFRPKNGAGIAAVDPSGVFVPSQNNSQSIRIGIPSGEPIRLEGLKMVFEDPPVPGEPILVPVVGTMKELLANPSVEYLVIDLGSASGSIDTLESVRNTRPGVRQIVIGPENNDELVLDSIVAGARAYLYPSAELQTVRMAIDVVVSGSIWAPRRLLSRLIDRLLGVPEPSAPAPGPQLTARECQVLELILLARSNREIALQLGIEERTVKAHVGRLMRKTGAENRIELSVRALNRSLMGESDSKSGSA